MDRTDLVESRYGKMRFASVSTLFIATLMLGMVPLPAGSQGVQVSPHLKDKKIIKFPRVTLTATPAPPTTVNAPVTLTAQIVDGPATPAQAPVYTFTVVRPNNQTVQIQNGPSPGASYTPPGAGEYTFTVRAQIGGVHPTRSVHHSVKPISWMGPLSALPTSPAQANSGTGCAKVTLTAGLNLPGNPQGMTHKYRFSWTFVGGTNQGTPGASDWGNSPTRTVCIKPGFYNLYDEVQSYNSTNDYVFQGGGYVPSYVVQ